MLKPSSDQDVSDTDMHVMQMVDGSKQESSKCQCDADSLQLYGAVRLQVRAALKMSGGKFKLRIDRSEI